MATTTRPLLRSVVVLLTICAWLAISNHCALASWSMSAAATESCPMHPKSGKPEQGSAQVCCKILRAASAPATVKTVIPQAQPITPEQAQFPAVLLLSPHAEPLPSGLDTGPPGLGSFAELVLQRSLLGHAPPSLG